MASNPGQEPPSELIDLADAVHSAAIRLLRRLRVEDRGAGLSGPALSALSVAVFNPGLSQRALAELEQVSAPAMSRVLAELESEGLVAREPDPEDARARRIIATPEGERRLGEGRERRVGRLAEALAGLAQEERDALARATAILAALNDR